MSEETKENLIPKTELYYTVHMLIIIVFAVGIAWFSNEIILENAWNKQYFLFAGALCAVIALCSFLERKKLYESVRNLGILMACFMVSGLLLLLSDFYINLPIWLLGGIATAALINRNIGMLYLYYFVFHAIYLQGNWMNGLVFHFVVASLIAFFIPKMKSVLSMLYMMAFAACIIVTGSIIHNQMAIDGSMLLDTFYILCTYLTCILITMFLVKWNSGTEPVADTEAQVPDNYAYLDLLAQDTARKDAEAEAAAAEAAIAEESETITEEASEEITEEATEEPTEEIIEEVTEEAEKPEEAAEEVTEEITEEVSEEITEEATGETTEEITEELTEETTEAVTEEPTEEVTEEITEEVVEESEAEEVIDYTPYCDEKAELLQELRTKDKAAYARAILVGKLASTTAESMGLNKDLTKAAGLYKFIGKIRENNNEYTATEIAKEHNFPEPLIYLLDQLNHNIVEQKEAAVILITYGVISNYSIVRGAQKDVPVEKIVDTVVSKKIFQGEFNESGLNVQECFMLREKLISLLKDQDKKHAAKQMERKKA